MGKILVIRGQPDSVIRKPGIGYKRHIFYEQKAKTSGTRIRVSKKETGRK